jgi:hypothetical protein
MKCFIALLFPFLCIALNSSLGQYCTWFLCLQYHYCSLYPGSTTAAICGHATLGKPKRFRQTVSNNVDECSFSTSECGKFRDTVDCSSKLLACKNDISYHLQICHLLKACWKEYKLILIFRTFLIVTEKRNNID